MSDGIKNFGLGQSHVRNGGPVPMGPGGDPNFFQGAFHERARMDAEARANGKPRVNSSGSGKSGSLLWGFLGIAGVAALIWFKATPSAVTSTISNPSSPVASSWEANYWESSLLPKRVTVATLKVRQFGNTTAPVLARLRRGDLIYTTVRRPTHAPWVLISYVDRDGQKRPGFVPGDSYAEE